MVSTSTAERLFRGRITKEVRNLSDDSLVNTLTRFSKAYAHQPPCKSWITSEIKYGPKEDRIKRMYADGTLSPHIKTYSRVIDTGIDYIDLSDWKPV